MKWKTTLTAEAAALFVTDLAGYGSFAKVEKEIASINVICPGPYDSLWVERTELSSNLAEAREIYEALWDEIHHAWLRQECGEGCGSILVLDSWFIDGESLSKKACKVSKKSLAEWFYEMDGIDKAKILYPHFDPQHYMKSVADSAKGKLTQVSAKPLGSKRENSYLRTIEALAKALISKGLTGKDSSDAKLILQKLAAASIEPPIKEKTLANYLKAARDIS